MGKIHIQNKRTVVATFVALLLVGVIAFVMVKMIPAAVDEEPLSTVEEVQTAAQDFAESNDIDGGLRYYDEQIGIRSDESEKKTLLLYKATFAQDAGRFDDALGAAQAADPTSSNFGVAEAMARAYEAKGDKAQALIYYKKLLELSPKEGLGSRYVPVWEEKIRELEE